MKKTRITAGIIVVLGIGIYLVAGSYSVLGIITAAFFDMYPESWTHIYMN